MTEEKKVCRPITERGLYTFYSTVNSFSWLFVDQDDVTVDQKFDNFLNMLEMAYLQSFPERTYLVCSDQSNNISWFNDTLRGMRETLGFLSDHYQRSGSELSRFELNNFKNTYKKAIKDAKVSANDRLINTSKNPVRTMWRVINKFRGKPSSDAKALTNQIRPDEFIDYFADIANNLIEGIGDTSTSPFQNLEGRVLHCEGFAFRDLSFIEVRDIINGLVNKGSTDVYGFNVRVIKTIKNIIYIPLTKLINNCFRANTFPSGLKKAIVVPIFKAGDSALPSNYRPISLLPIISKILEKCMALRIADFFETNNLFSASQFGFRQGRSTVLGILDLVSNIMESFEAREYHAATFYDLSKAFDCVTHSILLRKLQYYNFHTNSIELLKSYLEGRTQDVKVGGALSAERVMGVGVPQGSILGPLLFLIYINDLPLTEPPGTVTLFADDTSLSCGGDSLDLASERLCVSRSRVEEWFSANKFVLNKNKTHNMIFSLRDISDLPDNQEHAKFLGIYIDNKLKFDHHVDFVCGRMRSGAFALRGLSACVPLITLKTAYYALVHSVLSYACVVWGHSSHACRVFGL